MFIQLIYIYIKADQRRNNKSIYRRPTQGIWIVSTEKLYLLSSTYSKILEPMKQIERYLSKEIQLIQSVNAL